MGASGTIRPLPGTKTRAEPELARAAVQFSDQRVKPGRLGADSEDLLAHLHTTLRKLKGDGVPSFVNLGDRLDQVEFHRVGEVLPECVRIQPYSKLTTSFEPRDGDAARCATHAVSIES